VELLVHVDDYPNLDKLLRDLSVDVVVGHLGYCRPDRSADDPGFQALLRLMRTGRCWTKLTGPYRVSAGELPYSSAAEFARQLVREAPERVLWGSDWPHVMVRGAMPNDGDLLDLLFDWVPDAAVRHDILVDNAAKLYDF
jgi:predicted TIM-barrel fold metal-dependent hydrolase